MQYYNKYKKLIFKCISVLTAISIMIAGFGFIVPVTTNDVYAGAAGNVEVTVKSLVSGNYGSSDPFQINSLVLRKGNYGVFKVHFDDAPATVTFQVGTNMNETGAIEMRVGSQSGEVIAAIEPNEKGSWAVRDYTVTLSQEISGDVELYVIGLKGTMQLHTMNFWVPGPNGGRYPEYPVADKYGNIADLSVRNEVNMLYDLGILLPTENGMFDYDMSVTRGDFANTLSRLFSIDGGNYAATVFNDIDAKSPYLNSVSLLVQMGFIKQDAAKFRPYEFITLDEALEWLLPIAGLDINDKRKTLRAIANSKKLLDDVNVDNKYVNNADMAALVYNTVTCDPIDRRYYSDNAKYKVTGQRVLESKGIYYAEGVVEANNLTSINSNEETISDNSVVIDGIKYEQGKCYAASSYVGMKVRYFYTAQTGKHNQILSIALLPTTELLVLDGRETDFVNIEDTLISYYEPNKNKPKKITLGRDTRIIYNDKLIEASLSDVLGETTVENFKGKIMLIDNNDDNNYDVVKVYNAVTIIFGGIGETGIYDLLREKTYSFSSDKDILIYLNSSMAEMKSLTYGSVVDLYMTENSVGQKIFRAVICSDNSEYLISEINGDGEYVTETGETFEKYPLLDSDIELGKEYMLYINSFGQIAKAEPVDNDKVGIFKEYAYSDDGFDGHIYVKIIDSECVEQMYETANKIYFDGVNKKNRREQNDAFENIVNRQPSDTEIFIRYRLNSQNMITLIDTPTTVSGGARDVIRSLTNGKKSDMYPKTNIYMDSNYTGVCPVDAGATVYMRYNVADENIWLKKSGIGSSTSATTVDVFTDDAGDEPIGKYIVRYLGSNSDYKDAFTVTNITKAIEDDEEVIYIYGKTGKDDVVHKVNSDIYAKDSFFKSKVDIIKKGDYVITSKVDDAIIDIQIIYYEGGSISRSTGSVTNLEASLNSVNNIDYDSRKAGSKNDGRTPALARTTHGIHFHGYVTDKAGSYLKIRLGNDVGSLEEWVYCQSNSVAVISDRDGARFIENKKGADSVIIGDHIMVSFNPYEYSPSMIAVYR